MDPGIGSFFRRVVVAWPALLLALAVEAGGPAFDLARLDEPADSGAMREEAARLDGELRRHPGSATLYAQRGAVRFKLRDFDQSIADFSAALELNDKLDEAYFGRGMAHGRNGQIEEAVRDFGIYLHRHPDNSLAYTKRGIRYLWGGDLDQAEKDFARAIALDPRNAEAHDDLGVIRAQRGDYDTAERHFHTVVRTDPTYQKGWHNLAMVYHITGRHERALGAVDRALALIPNARDSLLLKCTVLETLGRYVEAKKLCEEAEFLTPADRSSHMPIQ